MQLTLSGPINQRQGGGCQNSLNDFKLSDILYEQRSLEIEITKYLKSKTNLNET